jgi:hypothetical protein
MKNIETESCCFDVELVKDNDLSSDLVALVCTNHAGEQIYMICQRDTLKGILEKL